MALWSALPLWLELYCCSVTRLPHDFFPPFFTSFFFFFSVDHGCGSLQIPRGLAGGLGSHAIWEEPGPAAGGGGSNRKAEILCSEVHQVSVHLADTVPEGWGERAAPSLCPQSRVPRPCRPSSAPCPSSLHP